MQISTAALLGTLFYGVDFLAIQNYC